MHPLLTHSSKDKKQKAEFDELKSYKYLVNYHKDLVPPVGSIHKQLSFFGEKKGRNSIPSIQSFTTW